MRKNILITGASSGLGEGMARELAARGRNLALCARRTDRLEALRAELLAKHPGIQISVRPLDVNDHAEVFRVFDAFAQDLVYPGYIRTELNEGAKKLPFEVDAATGSRALVKAIEREPVKAYVPGWPWTAVGFLLRNLPLKVIARMS